MGLGGLRRDAVRRGRLRTAAARMAALRPGDAAARRDGRRRPRGLACDRLCGRCAGARARRARPAGAGHRLADAAARRWRRALSVRRRVGARGRRQRPRDAARAPAHRAGLVCGQHQPLGARARRCAARRERGLARPGACGRALAHDRSSQGAARQSQSARLRLRAAAVGAGRAGQRLRAHRRARCRARAHRPELAAPRRAGARIGARRDPGARGRSTAGRRRRGAGHRRPERDRPCRLGCLPRHRRRAPDVDLGAAHHHVRLARSLARRRALATQRPADAVVAGAACGTGGRRAARHALCALQRLGPALAAHRVDAGHGRAAAPRGTALALALRLALRLRGGGGARSVGADAAGLLAQLRGRRRAVRGRRRAGRCASARARERGSRACGASNGR